jgi:hypothetical protein
MIYNIKKEKVEIIRKEIKFINLYQLNNQSIGYNQWQKFKAI